MVQVPNPDSPSVVTSKKLILQPHVKNKNNVSVPPVVVLDSKCQSLADMIKSSDRTFGHSGPFPAFLHEMAGWLL